MGERRERELRKEREERNKGERGDYVGWLGEWRLHAGMHACLGCKGLG